MQTVVEKEEIWPNFHSLRASYTMNLLLKGTPILIVQKVLGHLDLKTTQQYIGELKKSDIIGTSVVLFENEKKGVSSRPSNFLQITVRAIYQ